MPAQAGGYRPREQDIGLLFSVGDGTQSRNHRIDPLVRREKCFRLAAQDVRF
jgi:hypothetical protein